MAMMKKFVRKNIITSQKLHKILQLLKIRILMNRVDLGIDGRIRVECIHRI
jgi:hypothetical protein